MSEEDKKEKRPSKRNSKKENKKFPYKSKVVKKGKLFKT